MRFLRLFLILFTPLSAVSLEEQVGQLFISFVYDEELESFLEETRLGNIIYFNWANDLSSPAAVRALSDRVRASIRIPPLIAIDQEGGRVARLREGFTVSPGNRFLEGPDEAYFFGKVTGEELRGVGINCNLAPVVDVDSNPNNPVIGSRSFGSDPDYVALMGESMIQGLHDGGVLTVLKHFPGHGDTHIDSHLGLPVVNKTVEELELIELKPFKKLHPYTDAIMTAHIVVPALDSKHPATHSYRILTELLRDEWGYEGVIISDSLVMRGIAPAQETFESLVQSVSKAAIQAFQAGCDLLILGRPDWADFKLTQQQDQEFVRLVLQNFKQAIETGEIPEAGVGQSLERIYKLKQKADSSLFSWN